MIDLKEKTVLITGATSGIGKAAAFKFAENKSNLILVARRKERLDEISEILSTEFKIKVHSIKADVRNYESVKAFIESLPDDFKKIDILINNAGLARGFSNISDGSVEDWDEMIDTNVKGLLYVSKCIVPLMIKNNSGHIINIGSVAGREVYPNGNVYCATKHAVDAITKSLRMELVSSPIKVTTIDPGLVETEFSLVRYRGDSIKAGVVYSGMKPLTSEDVAEAIIFAVTRNDNFVVAEMVLLPKAQASSLIVNREKV
ncbi:MAG TPA: SDR family NAD(P)-dependent oxidoreductase [Ignavibacteria bacterium]|nr:SDR family NAD(P)-dependent oxidoreductase [Ignavibacteria bacterium]HRB00635.1 SDR family NAD(P)-dependent oxidoreductase [Ignavibacteria bacterium]